MYNGRNPESNLYNNCVPLNDGCWFDAMTSLRVLRLYLCSSVGEGDCRMSPIVSQWGNRFMPLPESNIDQLCVFQMSRYSPHETRKLDLEPLYALIVMEDD